MPDLVPQNSNQVYTSGSTSRPLSKVLIIIIVILALLAGLAFAIFQGQKINIGFLGKSEPTVVEVSKLPIPVTILTNPIFTQWRAGFEGRVTSKTDKTFTVEKDGAVLKIDYTEGATYLYDKQSKKELKLADLPLNSNLIGGVWIFRTDTPSGPTYQVSGDSINVEKPANL